MKTILELWSPTRLTSDTGGNAVLYFHDPALIDKLGQAKSLRLEVVVLTRSSNLARLDVSLYEGARKNVRPSAGIGGSLIGSVTTVSTLGITNIDAAGPFHGRVEITLGARSNTPTAGVQEWIEVAVNATLTMQ